MRAGSIGTRILVWLRGFFPRLDKNDPRNHANSHEQKLVGLSCNFVDRFRWRAAISRKIGHGASKKKVLASNSELRTTVSATNQTAPTGPVDLIGRVT